MLTREWNIDDNLAGALYSLPFLISAFVSPFLGLLIDKIGKRAMMIMLSSFFVIVACVLTAILVTPDYIGPNWSFLAPLIILGLAYSVYAGALWSSIPYVVKPNTLGTAFGLCTAIQNIGMTILPIAVGATIKTTNTEDKYYGYIHEMMLLSAFATVGFCFNIWLYVDDLKNRDGQLDKVPKPKGEGEGDGGLTDMMTSPTTARKLPGEEIEDFDLSGEDCFVDGAKK